METAVKGDSELGQEAEAGWGRVGTREYGPGELDGTESATAMTLLERGLVTSCIVLLAAVAIVLVTLAGRWGSLSSPPPAVPADRIPADVQQMIGHGEN